jgi:hypothetical protein
MDRHDLDHPPFFQDDVQAPQTAPLRVWDGDTAGAGTELEELEAKATT